MRFIHLTKMLWIRLILIVLICLAPMSLVFKSLLNESNYIISNNEVEIIKLLNQYEKTLKKIANIDKADSEIYKKYFYESVELKQKINDERKILEVIKQNVLKQSLIWIVFIFFASSVFAWYISRKIVNDFQDIIYEHQINLEKINSLSNIAAWQNTAKIIIHEIRTPLTPIKLVLTALSDKINQIGVTSSNDKNNIEKDLFISQSIAKISDHQFYLNENLHSELQEGIVLSLNQISSIEKWIYSFTEFAKLPTPVLTKNNLLLFLNEFKKSIEDQYLANKPIIKINIQVSNPYQEENYFQCYFDEHLIYNLLFNLIKNGIEANTQFDFLLFNLTLNRKSQFNKRNRNIFDVKSQNTSIDCLELLINNQGNLIPQNIESKVFDLSVSAKKGLFSNNLGVGLTVCKKIAMDHGGDLKLVSNSNDKGVTFSLIFPLGLSQENSSENVNKGGIL